MIIHPLSYKVQKKKNSLKEGKFPYLELSEHYDHLSPFEELVQTTTLPLLRFRSAVQTESTWH